MAQTVGKAATAAGDTVEDLAFAMWERLAAGDVRTWAAFVVVALFVLLFVGLKAGSITIKREG